jgi:hypothetical protein
MRLDGGDQPAGPRVLFIDLGGGRAAGLAGGSRAAQWMLLDQLADEVRGRIPAGSNAALLTHADGKQSESEQQLLQKLIGLLEISEADSKQILDSVQDGALTLSSKALEG